MEAAGDKDAGRPADKGTAILEAALTLFVRSGFHATRVEEIAERAGVAKGTVYEYFPSKEALFKGILDLSFQRYCGTAREAVRSRGRASAQLAALIEASQAFARENRPLARIVLETLSGMDEQLRVHILTTRAQVRQIFQQVIEAGIQAGEFRPLDPDLATSAVMGAVTGLFKQWIFGEQGQPPAEAAAQLLDLLLQGLSAPGGDQE